MYHSDDVVKSIVLFQRLEENVLVKASIFSVRNPDLGRL